METRKTVLFITHSIEEAIGLSDRVLVMSPNPGRIVDEIAIDLPRPRPAVLGEDPSFNAYAERIHGAFLRMGVIKYCDGRADTGDRRRGLPGPCLRGARAKRGA